MPTMRGLKGRKKMFDKSKLTEQERKFVDRHERLHEEMRKILGVSQEEYDAATDVVVNECLMREQTHA